MGSWEKNFMFNGFGIYCIHNVEIYKGTLKDNIKTGHGVCKYNNKNIYKGYWKDNVKHGIGTLITISDGIFTGQWDHNTQVSGKLKKFQYKITGFSMNMKK